MAPVLEINGRDLSQYLNVQHDAGLDPFNAERMEEQFTGSPVFAEGLEFTNTAEGNRQWTVPLLLEATTRAALHQLIRDIGADLFRGAQVEFASDPADARTYFDLEAGHLEPQYQYFITAIHSTCRAVLTLHTRPSGHTATHRAVASIQATGPVTFNATGIIGDREALTRMAVRVGSTVASGGRLVAYGVHRQPSYLGFHHAASAVDKPASALATGASGAVGSMYLAVAGQATGASGITLRDYLAPPAAYVGRSRVLAVVRSNLMGVHHSLYAVDRFGAVLGPTAVASQTDPARWQVIDLGEVMVPARASGQEAVPTQYVELRGGGGDGVSYKQASGYGLAIQGLQYIPLDISPGILRTGGAGGDQLLYGDAFTRIEMETELSSLPNADLGGVWTMVGGHFGSPDSPVTFDGGEVGPGQVAGGAAFRAETNASALAALASGAQLSSVQAEVDFRLAGAAASRAAPSTLIDLWAKAVKPVGTTASYGVWARLNIGARVVDIRYVDGAGESSLGTALVPSSVLDQSNTMRLEVIGASAQVWVGTTVSGAALITGGNTRLGLLGYPALRAQIFNGSANSMLLMDRVSWSEAGGSAPDIGSREWFTFEEHPVRRTFQGNASVYTAERAADFRGVPVRLPPMGTAMPSGPARVVMLTGSLDDFLGNDLQDIQLRALERFSFLR